MKTAFIILILLATSLSLPLKVAVIIDGDTNDQGYNYQIQVGAEMTQLYFEDDIEVFTAANVTGFTAPCYTKSVEFINAGVRALIYITSRFTECAKQISTHYPFIPILVGGNASTEVDPNYPNVSFTSKVEGLNELRYLIGGMVGNQKHVNKVCFVSNFAFVSNLYVLWTNLQYLGLMKEKPNADYVVIQTSSFDNVTQETIAFNYAKNINCKVIISQLNSAYLHTLARDNNILSVGWASDKRSFVGDTVLISVVRNFYVSMIEFIERIQSGNYVHKLYEDNLINGGVDLSGYSPSVSRAAFRYAEVTKRKIMRNKLNKLYCGAPVREQYGTRCTTEENLSSGFLPGMIIHNINN